MNVLYDFQIFSLERFGGVSRYFHELMRNSQTCYSWNLASRYSNNSYVEGSPLLSHIQREAGEILPGFRLRGKARLTRVLRKARRMEDPWAANMACSLAALKAGHHDVFHPTYYDDYFLQHLAGSPYVLTIYDMIHEIYPEYFPLDDPTSLRKRRLAERAARIIAISESTKRDIVKILGLDPSKIDVVHLGNSLDPQAAKPATTDVDLPKRYLLFTGNRTIYKNFYFFLSAIAGILNRDGSLFLVCTGKEFTSEERRFFAKLGIGDKIRELFFVDDAQLATLYSRATAFVFPSLYEGFGLPVLEAYACGCPTLLSNTSSLPEVGGNASMYFDPKDTQSIRGAVEAVVGNDSLRKDLIARGYERLKEFSWNKTASETAKVYRKVCP